MQKKVPGLFLLYKSNQDIYKHHYTDLLDITEELAEENAQ